MAAKSKSAAISPADAIDRQLERYRSMRDFSLTAEPSGDSHPGKTKSSKSRPEGLPFVIQKHAATRLHYDFRLGWNGVLKSWACAKGPSYVTADKRLAVQVEDHPMEYGGFEGIIPKGQYGGGTVMLWDEGTWEPQAAYPDVDEGLRTGSLKFILHGEKLKGKWALIRMGGKAANESKPNWLLIKEHDDFERKSEDPAVTEVEPNSVITGRSIEEIAKNEDHVWNSKETASGNAWYRKENGEASKAVDTPKRKPAANPKQTSPAITTTLEGTPKERLPDFITPQLASPASSPPNGKGWLHELKLDGYRIQARKDGARVQLLTRTGLDWTHRMKPLAAEVAKLPAETLIADGEVVVLANDGTTSFADLQAAFQESANKPLTYFAFDLLHLNGHNLRSLPLRERKAILAKLLPADDECLRLSEHLETSGDAMFRGACEVHAEGIISKRADSKYSSGRSASWLKLKCIRQQELAIGGFTLPSNGIHGVGALLLGYYQGKKLIYAGRTGTGFTQKTHKILRDRLDKLREKSTSFEMLPAEAKRGAIWVKPELVAEINFATWTADNLVRQAAFQGLREDKPASEVVREQVTISPVPNGGKRTPPSAVPHLATTAHETTHRAASQTKSYRETTPGSAHPAIRLTHPDKILDPESKLTKQQLADYYWAIAPHMLPHIAGRPLSLVRCPDGVSGSCFFQKHATGTLPRGIESVMVPDKKTGKPEPYITLSTPIALAELAQMGVLEIHPWGSRNDDLEHPDRITIDLDPDTAISWQQLAASATHVRKQLKNLGLESFLKTTGGKGLHVVVPIHPEHEWPVVKQFAHAFALVMEKSNPALYLTKMTKSARAGRIYIDYLRNERGATAVAAYSPRSRPGAAVSLPLPWSDLKLEQRPIFRAVDYEQWKSRLKRDPWKDLAQSDQRLNPKTLNDFRIVA